MICRSGRERYIKNRLIKNVLNLILSNILSLFIGVLSAFVISIVLGHEQYGYYKIFTLYVSYVPLLHVGFIDGIVVKYSGRNLNNIPLSKFRSYTLFIFYFEFILSSIMILFTIFINASGYYKEILYALAIYSFFVNMVTYFQFFSKCIMRFDELARIMRFQSYINFVYLALAYIIYKTDLFRVSAAYYLIFMCLTQFIILIWYLVRYKFIIFGKRYSIKKEKRNILNLFKFGFMVMLSYQVVMFMVNSDNQFISIFFSVRKYSEYAFAYSLAFILVTVFGAVSAVVLPYMKKAGKNMVAKNYSINLSIICILIFFIMFSYYPIAWIVNNFLYSYVHSINYLKVVFPGVGITCIVQSYFFNNYVLFNRVKVFCLISLLNLLFDYMVYYAFYLLFKNTLIIALLSIPLLLVWYICLEIFVHKLLKVKTLNNMLYVIIMSLVFILVNYIFNFLIGAMVYFIIYVLITLIVYWKSIKQIRANILRQS